MLTIRVEAMAGNTILQTCEDAVALAQRTGCLIRWDFNGVITYARPSDTPEGIEKAWRKEMDRKGEHKIAFAE